MRARSLLALPLAAALLGGCASDPGDERREAVAVLTEAANRGDADEVRERADALLALLEVQRERGDVAADEAGRLVPLARAVRTSADVIDAELLERQRVEAERARIEQEREQLEEERKRLEEERKAEEAARQAEEERRTSEEGKGAEGDDKDDKDAEGKDEGKDGGGKDD